MIKQAEQKCLKINALHRRINKSKYGKKDLASPILRLRAQKKQPCDY